MYTFAFEQCSFQIHSEKKIPNVVQNLLYFEEIRHKSFQKSAEVLLQNGKIKKQVASVWSPQIQFDSAGNNGRFKLINEVRKPFFAVPS